MRNSSHAQALLEAVKPRQLCPGWHWVIGARADTRGSGLHLSHDHADQRATDVVHDRARTVAAASVDGTPATLLHEGWGGAFMTPTRWLDCGPLHNRTHGHGGSSTCRM